VVWPRVQLCWMPRIVLMAAGMVDVRLLTVVRVSSRTWGCGEVTSAKRGCQFQFIGWQWSDTAIVCCHYWGSACSGATSRIPRCQPRLAGRSGRTPPSFASSRGYEGVVQVLLGPRGADPNLPNDNGLTLLSYAAIMGAGGATSEISPCRSRFTR